MKTAVTTMLALCFMMIPAAAVAEEELEKGWHAEVAAGLVLTSGNTDTETFTGHAEVINERQFWRHTGKVDANTSSSDDVTTAERYFALLKSDYKIGGGPNYLFGRLTYEDDRFSGYDYEASETVGYGRKVIDREGIELDLEIGAGARQREETDTGDKDDVGVVTLAGDFNWQFSEHASLAEELHIESGSDATITTSTTSLTSQLVGKLAAKFAFWIKHVTDVPPGFEETDTETTAALVYKY